MVKENLSQVDELVVKNHLKYGSFSLAFCDRDIRIFFPHPIEIADFCSENSRRITLDTAHLSMYCTFANISFIEALKILMPHTAHLA